jgi:hypothetical protein
MRRRELIKAIVGSFVARPLATRAQQSSKLFHIGFLANDPEHSNHSGWSGVS